MRTISPPEPSPTRSGRVHLVVGGAVLAGLAALAAVVGLLVLPDDEPSTQTFCEQLNEIYLADAAAAQTNVDDIELVRVELAAAAERFARLQDLAPDAIDGDVDMVADFARSVAAAAQDHPADQPFERAVALSEASAAAPEVEASLARLDTFRAASC
jgi:hypothetical protein